MNAEKQRLEEDRLGRQNWRKWGPYLSERQWGTVREDYSAGGDAWGHFPHEHARSRAYRWGEDGRGEPEFELFDTGVFDDGRYFDVFVEYAKAGPDDLLMQVTVHNRGPDDAEVHLLPQLWFRNGWSWKGGTPRPRLTAAGPATVI